MPFNATCLQVKGDPITDLTEDLAAEQKARSTYEYLIDLADDPDVIDVLKFLRQREVVHFQRFGEALRTVQEKLAEKKYYMNANLNLGNNNNRNNSGCCGCNMNKNNFNVRRNVSDILNDKDSDCGCMNMMTNNSSTEDSGCQKNMNNNSCGCDK